MLNKTLFLEIDRPNYVPIYSVQYDYNSRFYEITILNNSQPLDLTGIRVIVGGKKPDGKEVFNSCKVLDAKKGLIQLELTEQMNAVNGASEYALELFSADGMLSSQPFKLIVTRSTISKSVESSKELGALKDALNEVQDIDNRFAQTNAQLSEISLRLSTNEDISSFQRYSGRYGELRLPDDFDSKGIKLYRNNDGSIVHNLNLDLIENQKFDKILYFDTENGSDSNASENDGSKDKPYKTLRKCLEYIMTSGEVKFKIYGKGILLRNEVNATQPSTIVGKTIVVVADNEDGSKISVSNSNGNHRSTADNIEPTQKTTWTFEDGVYKTNLSAVVNCYDKKVRNNFGAVEPMIFASDINECKNTPNSWFTKDGIVYINTFDNREPDKDILPCRTITSTGFIIQNTLLYFKGFEFFTGDGVGGYPPYATFDSGVLMKGDLTSKVYFVDCNAAGGNATTTVSQGNGVRGFKIIDVGQTYMINCICPYSTNDNFSYVNNQIQDNLKKELFVFEYNCVGFNSGMNSTGENNQISTQHNGSNILRVNGNYWNSGGQVIADTGGVYSVLVDCKANSSRLDGAKLASCSYSFDNASVFGDRKGKVCMINCSGNSDNCSIDAYQIEVMIDGFHSFENATKRTKNNVRLYKS